MATPTAFALEVDRCRVEEHQVQTAKQISTAGEQGFLEGVFGADLNNR